jgi:tetratricopeptide (TPR) repeat protein
MPLRLVVAFAVVLAFGIACASPKDARTQALEAQNEAHALAVAGHSDEAIARYTDAIALDPNIALIYLGRGQAYAGKQDYPAALADFNRALELDPNRSVATSNAGAPTGHHRLRRR